MDRCISADRDRIPGTSRSGATIIGALLLGVSRVVATEFTFYLAIPVMFGASLLKTGQILMMGLSFTSMEIAILAVGCIVSFVVSIIVIKFLMGYIKSMILSHLVSTELF